MSELAPFTPNKIIPVTDTSKNTTESTPVILLFLPSPFLIVPLYHPQCVVIWNIAATKIKAGQNMKYSPIMPYFVAVAMSGNMQSYSGKC